MTKNDYGKRAVVVAARRSAIGMIPGVLNQIKDVELLADVFKNVADGLHEWIDSAIVGSAFPVERDNDSFPFKVWNKRNVRRRFNGKRDFI